MSYSFLVFFAEDEFQPRPWLSISQIDYVGALPTVESSKQESD